MADYGKEINSAKGKATVSLTDRSFLSLSAVDEVLRFDEGLVSLSVLGATLAVSGSELSIVKLSLESGEVNISGRINALVYSDEQPKKGFLSKLFG